MATRKAIGDCIGVGSASVNGSTIGTIPANKQASRVLLQFYTDTAGTTAIGLDVMAYSPLVMVTEDGSSPSAGFAGSGIGIFHMGVYEVVGAANIANCKFLAFSAGYTVYCKVNYYR